MPGDTYQSTVNTRAINNLTIGPVENNVSRKPKREPHHFGNPKSDKSGPTFSDSDDKENTIESSSDEEMSTLDCSSEDDGTPGNTQNQFHTKFNIKIPDEGPPNFEIHINNVYQAPTFQLDAEATKEILSRDPKLLLGISSLPSIILSQSKQQAETSEKIETNTERGVVVADNEGTKGLVQRSGKLRRSCRRRNKNCSGPTENDRVS